MKNAVFPLLAWLVRRTRGRHWWLLGISAALQLAFKVSAPEVDQCADELLRHGVDLLSPPTDQAFGHRTLFFRDPDGNLLEVFAEI